MFYEATVDIDAPAEVVWAVLADVAQWPTWTSTVTRAELLDGAELNAGGRARMEQPKIRPAVWQVTEWEPGRSFTWVSKTAGVATVAGHRITTRAGGVTVGLSLRQTGALEPIIRPFVSGLNRRYLQTEAAGLKRRCESR